MKKLIAAIVVAGLILILLATTMQTTLEFGSPYSISTVTKGYASESGWSPNDQVMGPNEPNTKPDNSNWPFSLWGHELIATTSSEVVVTAWNPLSQGALSELISCQGVGVYPKCKAITALPPNMYPCRFYYEVWLYDQTNPTGVKIVGRAPGTGADTDRITVDTRYVSVSTGGWQPPMDHFPFFPGANKGDTYPCDTAHQDPVGNTYQLTSDWDKHFDIYNFPTLKCGYYWYDWPEHFSFNLKGQHIGYLKVEYWNEVKKSTGSLPCDSRYKPILLQEDKIYLASGSGSFKIQNLAGSPQTTFEEGDTAVFNCNVAYSGAALGHPEDGWSLRLFNLNTNQEWTQNGFPKTIPDNSPAYKVNFVIPTGVFDPTKDNQWRVVLCNNLFDQEISYMFSIDKYDYAPGIPEVTFDKTAYEQGDTIYCTVRALANTLGSGSIAKFWVEAFYQPNPPPYLFGPTYIAPPSYTIINEGNGWFKTTFQFVSPLENDHIVEVRATANDGQGRQSINYGMGSVLSKDPDDEYFVVSITVRDSKTLEKISGALVELDGGTEITTGVDGKAMFPSIPEGEHSVSVTADGYRKQSIPVFVNYEDISKTVSLVKGDDFLLIIFAVIFSVVVLVIFVVFSILIVPPIRYILLIVGIVITILVFYLCYFTEILSGLLAGL
jgi:hypothetical protein